MERFTFPKGAGLTYVFMATDGRTPRVLIVEDDEEIAQALQRSLRLEGYEVRVAPDGERALGDARSYIPDLVVLDLGLPGLDGYQVAQRLREDPALKSVTLIAATGYGQEEDLRRSREVGFDQHLVKPIDPGELQRLLAELAADPAVARGGGER